MARSNTKISIIPLLRSAWGALFHHAEVFLPFAWMAFIQLLVLEVLYFAPRYPLNEFFGPLISKFYGPGFVHYPLNFAVMPQMFQALQYPLFMFVNCFLIGSAIFALYQINEGKTITIGRVFKRSLGAYLWLVLAALIMVGALLGLTWLYDLVIERAMKIRSTSGHFYLLKVAVIRGAPFVRMFIGVFVTVIFAYLWPIIIIEKRKIFSAFGLNFKHLWGSFWYTLTIVLIPSLLYVPILVMQSLPKDDLPPEAAVVFMVVTVLLTVCIDALVYLSIATYYLVKREEA